MIQPTRPAFWRFILFVTFLLSVLAGWNLIYLAGKLEVDILSRPTWIAALSCLFLFAGIMLLGFIISYSNVRDSLWDLLELPPTSSHLPRAIGIVIFLVGLTGFAIVTSIGGFQKILNGEDWMRIFVFWLFSLLGMVGIKILRKDVSWFAALIAIILSQATLQLLLSWWPLVTSYPFALGWSETSRFYFPSLFLSKKIYGQEYALPILHPTLHLLLTPPYLLDAPLWAHRFWQVAIRYVLIAAVVPAMMRRVVVQGKEIRWLVAMWMFLYLFMGPVYFHLAVPVLLILIGFSLQNDRRNWFVILLASAWCGWSRVNWYPMPAMIAVVLYVLEMPIRGKSIWHYLWKPALWGMVGTLTAFAFQRFYIGISGVADAHYFYTSIASSLLWYRLLPNATYPPGVLSAAILVSLPMWFGIYLVIRSRKEDFHSLRIGLLITALSGLFVGGLLVSIKIGGGADLHNMDAYFVILLVIFSYLAFANYRREDGASALPVQLHWLVVFAVIIPSVLPQIQTNIGWTRYDESRTQFVLEDLQERVDQVNVQGGKILFITQRQLISMDMLNGVTLIPEYEREDLMEMAMADNQEYLAKFRTDMRDQRFALIVVDRLNFLKMDSRRSFAEENNVWVKQVARHILCNYREDAVFPEDDIVLYVPQVGERHCP